MVVSKIGNDTSKLLCILLMDDLKLNLIFISQLCDKGSMRIFFEPNICSIISPDTGSMIFIGNRHANIYILNFNELNPSGVKCLVVGGEDANL